MCIGNVFAMMEARLILAAIAQRFSLRAEGAPRGKPQPNVTLRMATPFHARAVPRPYRAAQTTAHLPRS